MKKLTIIPGDGIGPEIMTQVVRILKHVHAPFEYEDSPHFKNVKYPFCMEKQICAFLEICKVTFLFWKTYKLS